MLTFTAEKGVFFISYEFKFSFIRGGICYIFLQKSHSLTLKWVMSCYFTVTPEIQYCTPIIGLRKDTHKKRMVKSNQPTWTWLSSPKTLDPMFPIMQLYFLPGKLPCLSKTPLSPLRRPFLKWCTSLQWKSHLLQCDNIFRCPNISFRDDVAVHSKQSAKQRILFSTCSFVSSIFPTYSVCCILFKMFVMAN